MYITPDTLVKQVAQTAFPDYNGRKFKVEIANTPLDLWQLSIPYSAVRIWG